MLFIASVEQMPVSQEDSRWPVREATLRGQPAPSTRSREEERDWPHVIHGLNNAICHFGEDLIASAALANILYILECILNFHKGLSLISGLS